MSAEALPRPAPLPLGPTIAVGVLGLLPLVIGAQWTLALGGLALVAVTAWWLAALLAERDLFSPTALFPLAYLTYFGLGQINVTTGHVPSSQMLLVLLGLAGYLAGVAAVGWLTRRSLLGWQRHPPRPERVPRTPQWWVSLVALGCVGVGTAAAALIVLRTGGTPLANLGQRHSLSAYLFAVAELAWVGVVWWNLDRWIRTGRLHLAGILGLMGVAALLALLAYRTPLLALMLVTALGYHRLVSPLRPRHLVALFAGLAIFAGGYGWWRLQNTDRYGGYSGYLETAGVKWSAVEPIAPLATTVREGSVVLALLRENVPSRYDFQGGAVTFSTVTTLLPGWQRGPREWIGIYARGLEHSTTPSILGFLYVDWGVPGIAVGMALFGALLAWLYHLAREHPTPLTVWLWAYFTAAFLLSIHTGFADFRHIVLTVFALGLAFLTSPRPLAWLESRA